MCRQPACTACTQSLPTLGTRASPWNPRTGLTAVTAPPGCHIRGTHSSTSNAEGVCVVDSGRTAAPINKRAALTIGTHQVTHLRASMLSAANCAFSSLYSNSSSSAARTAVRSAGGSAFAKMAAATAAFASWAACFRACGRQHNRLDSLTMRARQACPHGTCHHLLESWGSVRCRGGLARGRGGSRGSIA